MIKITHVILPILHWSDRTVELLHQQTSAVNSLVKKLVIAGNFLHLEKNVECSFVCYYDCQHPWQSMTKAFKSSIYYSYVTCLGYGPYDNGHILVGMSNGRLLCFRSLDMNLILSLQVFQQQIKHICFEPTQLVILSCHASSEIVALSFIQKTMQYVYVELGHKRYCTIVMNGEEEKKGRSISPNKVKV